MTSNPDIITISPTTEEPQDTINTEIAEDDVTEPTADIPQVAEQYTNWTPCTGLFPYTGNQANSTFIDTTAGANLHVTGTMDTITNGYEVRGCVQQIAGTYDNWVPFEGYLGTYRIKDSSGTTITSGPLTAVVITAQPEVMAAAIAGDNLAFQETVTHDFSAYAGQTGTLELVNDNPSGETSNDRSAQYNITF